MHTEDWKRFSSVTNENVALTDSLDVPRAVQHLLSLPVGVAELGVAPGAAVDQEMGDLLDGINQIEADQDEDLSQGKRLYTLGELVVVEVKVQETVHLYVK